VPVSAPELITAWLDDATMAIPAGGNTQDDIDSQNSGNENENEDTLFGNNTSDSAANDTHRTAGTSDSAVSEGLPEDTPATGKNPLSTDHTIPNNGGIRIIDPASPMIALTFDDGPSQYTLPILDVLEWYGAVATFYVTGNRIENHADIVLRAYNSGNEIANHSWSHRKLTRLSEEAIFEDLKNTNDAIEAVTGSPPLSMRPTYGEYNEKLIKVTTELGLPVVMWTQDPMDWKTKDADATFDFIMENVKHGDIILLHDLSETTADAAFRVIPALIRRGYQLVTVTELMYYKGIAFEPGKVYNSGVEDIAN